MLPHLKSLAAALGAALVFASCSGGGSSSTTPMPGTAQTGPTAPAAMTAARAASSKGQHDVDDNDDNDRAGFTLFGDAVLVHPGNASKTAAQASWAPPPGAPFGGITFAIPATLTVAGLNTLSSDFKFTAGSCGGGSPRFSAAVTNGTKSGNIFFYFGPPPNYTGCPPNVWTNTGNLAAPTNLVDATQLGGLFYDPYAAVQAQFGTFKVTSISIVVDGFSPEPATTAQFDNVRINAKLTTFDDDDQNDDNDGRNRGRN